MARSPFRHMPGRQKTLRVLVANALGALAIVPALGHANPQGGRIVAGSASIAHPGAGQVAVTQRSEKAIIDWRSFSIGAKERTTFAQPNARAIALNRVVGVDPSKILGELRANGQVWLVNPNGIVFGKTARVDVAGLLATTLDISNRDFMAGNYKFTDTAHNGAMVVNAGDITVKDAGLVALVAPGVANSGVIEANLGKVQLASADGFTVDLAGNGLFNILLDKQVSEAIRKQDGTKPAAAISNTGSLIADDGQILLTADAAEGVVSHAIDMAGYARATSAKLKHGLIVLDGGSDGSVSVAGTLDASGSVTGQTGGTAEVLGKNVHLASGARIDVSGDAGGGITYIGGNFHGGGPQRNAQTTAVDRGATINADAGTSGDGGRVAVWSDTATQFNGTISARGGNQFGDGGFVETSSKQSLSVQSGEVTTEAPHGAIGTWLLDPEVIYVSSGGTASLSDVSAFATYPDTIEVITPDTIGSAESNVTLEATDGITFELPVTMLHKDVSLTARSGSYISVYGAITTSGGNIELVANDPTSPTTLGPYTIGAVYLTAPLSTNGGGATGGSIDIQVTAGSGDYLNLAPVSLVTAGGPITINATTDYINYISSSTESVLMDTTGAGSVPLGADISLGAYGANDNYGLEHDLSLNAGNGSISFDGNVNVGGLTIASARNVTATGSILAKDFFTDINQTGDLTIEKGLFTFGFPNLIPASLGGISSNYINAGPITIATLGNVTVGTGNAPAVVSAGGGSLSTTGTGGNGADVSIHAGGTVRLGSVFANGGVPINGSTLGGNAGNVQISGATISFRGAPAVNFNGQRGTYAVIGANGGPNKTTRQLLPPNIAGIGGNITLTGHVVVDGAPGTELFINNSSNNVATNITINGSVDAASPYDQSLALMGGHGQIVTGNIGAGAPLGNVRVFNDFSGSFGSVSSETLLRNYYTSYSFGLGGGYSTDVFNGPVDVRGAATLEGSNLLFGADLGVGGAATIGSANLSARGVFVSGPTTIASDTTISTAQSSGPITFAAINGTEPYMQALTLDAGNSGIVRTGPVGETVPLKAFTIISGLHANAAQASGSATQQAAPNAIQQATHNTTSGPQKAQQASPQILTIPADQTPPASSFKSNGSEIATTSDGTGLLVNVTVDGTQVPVFAQKEDLYQYPPYEGNCVATVYAMFASMEGTLATLQTNKPKQVTYFANTYTQNLSPNYYGTLNPYWTDPNNNKLTVVTPTQGAPVLALQGVASPTEPGTLTGKGPYPDGVPNKNLQGLGSYSSESGPAILVGLMPPTQKTLNKYPSRSSWGYLHVMLAIGTATSGNTTYIEALDPYSGKELAINQATGAVAGTIIQTANGVITDLGKASSLNSTQLEKFTASGFAPLKLK